MGDQAEVGGISRHLWETVFSECPVSRNAWALDFMRELHGNVHGKKTRIFINTYEVNAQGGALICEVQCDLGIYTKGFPPKLYHFTQV